MTTMLAKVARAMESAATYEDVGYYSGDSHRVIDNWPDIARTALEALMEPTEGLIEAAFETYAEKGPFVSPFGLDGSFAVEFQAMIRAALDGK
jgi:hypothetical protein